MGKILRIILSAVHRLDIAVADGLIDELATEFVVVDKVCESDDLWKTIRRSGAKPVISSGKGSRRRCDNILYKLRNAVEGFFGRLKHYWRVSMQYDKTDTDYLEILTLETQLVNYN